jgi:hypothetical protein
MSKIEIEISPLNLRCDERFTHAFTACGCVFKEITLVGSKQVNYFENATACSKRMLKTTVATQLKAFSFKGHSHLRIKCDPHPTPTPA